MNAFVMSKYMSAATSCPIHRAPHDAPGMSASYQVRRTQSYQLLAYDTAGYRDAFPSSSANASCTLLKMAKS
jgi:hypothetical protein